MFNADGAKDEDSETSTKYESSSENGLSSEDQDGFKERSISWLRNRQPLLSWRRSEKASPATIDKPRGTGNYKKWIAFIQSRARGNNVTIAPRRPARVEPKSYFANERTFIQWVSAALLLVTISVILLDIHIGSVGTDASPIPMAAGIVLNTVAVLVICYAIFAYYRRLTLLQSAASYGYVDHFAPIMLALASLLGIVILLFYYVDSNHGLHMGPTLVAQEGHCFQRPINGTSQLVYQPSGLLVDNKRDMILVPTVDRVTGLSMSSPSSPVVNLAIIPNADLEDITYAGDRVFVLGEGKDKPLLIELEWGNLTNTLQEVRRWELDANADLTSGRAEGLAYVPDDNGGSLYVAGDEYDPLLPQTRGAIYIFDIPPATSPTNSSHGHSNKKTPKLVKKGQLNRNLLNSGLLDSKIGSLHYFEGVLYVLNDNARAIRSWDIKTGELLSTTILPRVGVEFDKQWEGLALDRNSGDNPSSLSLRGAPAAPSSLTLHLALDTPPQIWSFTVSEAVNDQGRPKHPLFLLQ
jgi:uncharacterized membrane protein YidH (DUF202 family)